MESRSQTPSFTNVLQQVHMCHCNVRCLFWLKSVMGHIWI